MARKVFFSFPYERDIWCASQIRNSWVVRSPDREAAGFIDAASWEAVKRRGDDAVKEWINRQLNGTSVIVVLIGTETSERPFGRYEISRSHQRGNGLLGISIHNLRDNKQMTDIPGQNLFSYLYLEREGRKVYLSEIYRVYDWVNNDGYNNIGTWIEAAATAAGR